MSTTNNASSIEGTPTYLDTGDPDQRVTDFASNTTRQETIFRSGSTAWPTTSHSWAR